MEKSSKYYYLGIIILWLIYAGLTFNSPTPAQTTGRYGLSTTELRVLRATVVLPFLFIWLAGIYAVVRFNRYLKYISDSNEAEGFRNIVYGLICLLIVIVVPQFINLYTTYNPESFEIQRRVTIVRNYSNIILYLSAFWFILKASRHLVGSISEAKPNKMSLFIPIFMFVLSIFYILLIFLNDYRGVSDDPLIRPTYYLPDILIILTIALPYIIIWSLGTVAILKIHLFSKHVPGIIYRNAFSRVAFGLASIIGLSIIFQFISQSGAYFGRAGLGVILLIVYVILIAIAVAYLFIAKGAKALAAIEEI